jgi:hypothetical protein
MPAVETGAAAATLAVVVTSEVAAATSKSCPQ